MKIMNRLAAAFAAVVALAGGAIAAPTDTPIKIGSTLALTGPLAATGIVHKIVGEIYVDKLNKANGLLGHPVIWDLKDDQSKPDVTRTLYEQLLTVDKVDLLMGPYATPGILSAMAVAERYNKILIHHTFGIPSLAKYDMQFPAWALGAHPEETFPNLLFDALAAQPNPPKTIAIVTSKFPSVNFLSLGAREVAKKRGLKEVLFLDWDAGNMEFGPIAARLKDANPDFVWIGAIGLDGVELLKAAKKIDYVPPGSFQLYPAPGPTAASPESNHTLAATVFEQHPPFTNSPEAAEFVKQFNERAKAAGLQDNAVEVQAAVSYTAWQLLEAAVTATKSLDDKVLADWLKKNKVPTIIGTMRFDGPNNYGDDLMKIKQLTDGKWQVVWPAASAAPGAKLQYR